MPFECQKIAKNLTFLSKKLPTIFIFSKKLPIAIFWKKKFFGIFLKKCQFFGNFLTFNWQFSGGWGCYTVLSLLTHNDTISSCQTTHSDNVDFSRYKNIFLPIFFFKSPSHTNNQYGSTCLCDHNYWKQIVNRQTGVHIECRTGSLTSLLFIQWNIRETSWETLLLATVFIDVRLEYKK